MVSMLKFFGTFYLAVLLNYFLENPFCLAIIFLQILP